MGRACGPDPSSRPQYPVSLESQIGCAELLSSRSDLLFATLTTHRAGRIQGAAVEACFGACAAGVLGTLTQALRVCDPIWAVELFFALIFPAAFQLLDFALHSALGTARFGSGLIASSTFTAVSAMFNLFVMRRGALLIGREGKPFSHDLVLLPRLAHLFVVSVPRIVVQFVVGVIQHATGRVAAVSGARIE